MFCFIISSINDILTIICHYAVRNKKVVTEMNYKYNKLVLCVSFFICNGQAMDKFLGGFSSVNNFVQSASNFLGSDTGKGILSAVDSMGKSAQSRVDTNKKKAEEEKKRKEYFKETDYYIDKDNNLCIYKGGELFPIGEVDPNLYVENNIYYLDDNPYIYTKKDTIEPTIGHLKTIILEEDKYYKMDGVAHIYKDGKLQKYSVKSKNIKDVLFNDNGASSMSQIKKHNTQDLKRTSQSITQPKSDIQSQSTDDRLMKIEKKLRESINLSKKTKIIDLGFINIGSISDSEYNDITKIINDNIENKHTSAKIIIAFCTQQDTKKVNELRDFCKEYNLKLRFIYHAKIRNYIFQSFNVKDESNIDLKKIDIGKLTNEEILYIYANAVKLKTLTNNNNLEITMHKTSNNELTTKNITFVEKLFANTKITLNFKDNN